MKVSFDDNVFLLLLVRLLLRSLFLVDAPRPRHDNEDTVGRRHGICLLWLAEEAEDGMALQIRFLCWQVASDREDTAPRDGQMRGKRCVDKSSAICLWTLQSIFDCFGDNTATTTTTFVNNDDAKDGDHEMTTFGDKQLLPLLGI